MSSAAAGGANRSTKTGNEAKIDAGTLADAAQAEFAATSTTSAEAQQGDGPAAASASGSGATGANVSTVAVAVSCGKDYAVAACPVAVVAVGVNSASAGSENGVVAVGPDGAAASSSSANSTDTSVREGEGFSFDDDPDVARLLGAIRGELSRLAAENEAIKSELEHADGLDGGVPPAPRAQPAGSGKHAKADTAGKPNARPRARKRSGGSNR